MAHNLSHMLQLDAFEAIPTIISAVQSLQNMNKTAIAEVQNADTVAVSLLTSGSVDQTYDGKLRMLLAEDNSGLKMAQTSTSQKEVRLSVVKRRNDLQVSNVMTQFTLTHTMPNHTNVFNYANPNAIDNLSGGVTLSIDDTSGVR